MSLAPLSTTKDHVMTTHRMPWVLCAVPLFAAPACSTFAAEEGENAPNTITITGSTEDGLGTQPLPDVEICVFGHDEIPCVHSDLTAQFTLKGVPANSELLLSFFKADYFLHLATYTSTDQNDHFSYGLVSDLAMDAMASTVSVEIDGSKSQIIFGANVEKDGDRVEDVSVSMSPASGEGPFYQGTAGLDKTMSTTGSKGTGGFLNVEPGEYEITFTHPSKTCTPYFAWKGSQDGTVRFRLERTHSTYVSQICR
jgi:hypothetical protein